MRPRSISHYAQAMTQDPPPAMRSDEVISFQVPADEEKAPNYFANRTVETASALVAPELVAATQEAVGPGIEVRATDANVGRGVSGLGAAIQILVYIGGVGGGITTLVQGAEIARRGYRVLRRRLGHRPNVSLGAATFLAAADLADRLGHFRFVLLGCGDTNSRPMDQSFTGDDSFWVIFSDHPTLYVYIVAANGRVHYMGEHEVLSRTESRGRVAPGPPIGCHDHARSGQLPPVGSSASWRPARFARP